LLLVVGLEVLGLIITTIIIVARGFSLLESADSGGWASEDGDFGITFSTIIRTVVITVITVIAPVDATAL